MAQIISVVQEKGGSGKTTLLACLAANMAENGARVALIDTDPQQNLHQWAAKGRVNLDYLSELDDTRLVPTIQKISPEYDVILIDTAGFKSVMSVYAIGASDLVLIPSKATETDARGAFKTYEHVQSVSLSTRRDIPAYLIMMDVDKATNITQAVMESFQEANLPRLTPSCGHRTGFKEMFSTGEGPSGAARSAFSSVVADMQMRRLLAFYDEGKK